MKNIEYTNKSYMCIQIIKAVYMSIQTIKAVCLYKLYKLWVYTNYEINMCIQNIKTHKCVWIICIRIVKVIFKKDIYSDYKSKVCTQWLKRCIMLKYFDCAYCFLICLKISPIPKENY